jgi:hypothetical protein
MHIVIGSKSVVSKKMAWFYVGLIILLHGGVDA